MEFIKIRTTFLNVASEPHDSLPDIVYSLVWILEDRNRATSSITTNVAIKLSITNFVLHRDLKIDTRKSYSQAELDEVRG
uniref:Uncharacterized protein n=1 Tax=Cucumis melo TaxID=3656 RepID=A0A9I9EIV4_CUCME